MSLLPALLLTLPVPALPVVDLVQEPAPQEGEEERLEPPPKKAFDKLSSSKRKKAKGAISLLRGGRTDEARANAVETLHKLGEGVVPLLLAEWAALVEAERGVELRGLLDALLAEDALHLAWAALGERTPSATRRYVLRRWADGERKDTVKMLAGLVSEKDAGVAYEAARGLARRGDGQGFDAIAAFVVANWSDEAAAIRADFADVKRGPMTGKAAATVNARKRKDRLAGLHLFELFGVPEQSGVLVASLSESDTTLRLAAIDACRAVIDGDEPLERPSMTEIIERAETWKARILKRMKEPGDQGARR